LDRVGSGTPINSQKVRRNVRVFRPDGAVNEQIVGRLVAQTACPSMPFVMRCTARGIQNAIRLAWAADAGAQCVTKAVVNEVAKLLRSSSRFEAHLRSKAKEAGDITAVSNFDCSLQRFSF
jgi:hypothetical protein